MRRRAVQVILPTLTEVGYLVRAVEECGGTMALLQLVNFICYGNLVLCN